MCTGEKMVWTSAAQASLLCALLLVSVVGGQISSSCTTGPKRIECLVRNWNLALVGPGQLSGIVVNVTVPSNTYEVRLSLACDGLTSQIFALTTREGYETCNATVHPTNGKLYKLLVNDASTEISPTQCNEFDDDSISLKSLDFRYSGADRAEYYVINTALNSTIVATALGNRVGGACLSGLKLKLITNWQPPPTTMAPTIPSTTEPTAALIGGTDSSAMAAGKVGWVTTCLGSILGAIVAMVLY